MGYDHHMCLGLEHHDKDINDVHCGDEVKLYDCQTPEGNMLPTLKWDIGEGPSIFLKENPIFCLDIEGSDPSKKL